MIPLSEPLINGNEWKYVKECLDTGWVSSAGKFVEKFENDICAYTGASHAVACVNGTSALQVCLRLAGAGPGTEVIVPAVTFIAPVNAARYCGAEPVFMDCDYSLNIDCGKLKDFLLRDCRQGANGPVNKKTGRTVKAVVPVHVFGNPCDMAQVSALGKKFGFAVVEDATESLGSYYLTGKLARRHTGTIGELGVYSFNGNKIITTGGGGMIVCSDAGLARSARYLTTQAKDNPVKYVHNEIGYNFRLSNLQAAMGVAQLQTLERRIQAKRRNYRLYERLLAGIPGISLMAVAEGTRANYWLYAVLVDKKLFGMDKDGLMQRLAKAGIEARPLWMPNHLQKPYRGCEAYRLEQAVSLWKKVLNFPSSPQLSAKEIEYICATVRRIHKDGKR